MAKPPRQSGRRVTFTPAAAQRIARAVRVVERGTHDIASPKPRQQVGDDALVRGKFTGSWDKGDTKTVTDATLSSVTYEAKNYFASLTGTGEKKCCLGYVAGEWILIAAEC